MIKTKIAVILGVVLFISLSVNIFMAGVVVGNSVGGASKAVSDAVMEDRHLRDTLSEADRLILKQSMDANRKKITQLHDDIEKIKQDIREIVKEEPLDEKALGVALESQKNKEIALLRLAHESRKTAMDKMSPEGQAILSKVNHLGFDLNAQCH